VFFLKYIEAELALLPLPGNDKVPEKEKKLRLRRILEEDFEEMKLNYDEINAKRLADARGNQARAQQDLERRVLAAGSRFNLRFDRNVLPEALTPEGVMAVMENYVDFSQEAVDAAYERQRQRTYEPVEKAVLLEEPEYEPATTEEILKNLRKGFLYEDALALLGSPSREDSYSEGRFRVRACTFDRTAMGAIEAEFVEDVLVYYSISSR
jgi:beta-glucosidase-like glycosyl hydrolase